MLELLQARPVVGGAELASRLGVDRRTVRRYITALQDLGIPVDGARGAGGGYRLRPGYRLPPLMFDEEEAVQVALALAAAPHHGRALEKVQRVLPDTLRRRVEALLPVLTFTAPASPPPGRRRSSWPRRSGAVAAPGSNTAAATERSVPTGSSSTVEHWYLAAYDHDRDDLRTFRADRITSVSLLDAPALARRRPTSTRPAHVRSRHGPVPWAHAVEVRRTARGRGSRRRAATLRPTSTSTACSACGPTHSTGSPPCSPDWVRLHRHRPAELRDAVAALGARLSRAAR